VVKNAGLLHMTASWMNVHFVAKASAISQPIRSTQPYILLGSVNE